MPSMLILASSDPARSCCSEWTSVPSRAAEPCPTPTRRLTSSSPTRCCPTSPRGCTCPHCGRSAASPNPAASSSEPRSIAATSRGGSLTMRPDGGSPAWWAGRRRFALSCRPGRSCSARPALARLRDRDTSRPVDEDELAASGIRGAVRQGRLRPAGPPRHPGFIAAPTELDLTERGIR